MAHGLKILTKSGLTDVSEMKSGQLVQTSDHTTSSGSISTPVGTNATNSFAFTVSNDGEATPAVTFSTTTNFLSWDSTTGAAVSADFTINIIRYK